MKLCEPVYASVGGSRAAGAVLCGAVLGWVVLLVLLPVAGVAREMASSGLSASWATLAAPATLRPRPWS